MGLGLEVNRPILNTKAAEAVLQLRSALDKTEAIAKWLLTMQVVNGVDPLLAEPFNYNEDEAYVLRSYFEGVDALRVAIRV